MRIQAGWNFRKEHQVNAVRATFKAGITPSHIARQVGISQSDVRKDRDVKRPVVFILHL